MTDQIMTTPEVSPRDRLRAAMADLKITIATDFVPWSRSRHAKEPTVDRYAIGPGKGDGSGGIRVAHPNDRDLNWLIRVQVNGRTVIQTDYSAGIGHAPGYGKHYGPGKRWTNDALEAVTHETETGRAWTSSHHQTGGTAITPDAESVINSLILDADVIDYRNFEDWAQSFGYDTDSREAEKTYRACLAIGLALRAAVGDAGINALREAGQDF